MYPMIIRQLLLTKPKQTVTIPVGCAITPIGNMECIKCRKSDPEPMLCCDGCERPLHHECSNLSASELKVMSLRGKRVLRFYCEDCLTGVKLVPTLIKRVDDLMKEVEKLKNAPIIPAATPTDYEELLREIEDRNCRKQNIIIYNLPETPNLTKEDQATADSQHVKHILGSLSNDITVLDKPIRLGRFDQTKTRNRPVKVVLGGQQQVIKCIKNVAKVKTLNTYRGVGISNDRTVKQIEQYKMIKTELTRRQNAGEVNLKIKYIRGVPTIVSTN
nr:unnamed protein product [Callosobruchus chinensis]